MYRTPSDKAATYARAGSISTISIGELQQDINMQH